MSPPKLSPRELSVVVAALRVAAVQYAIDAHRCSEVQRLKEAFLMQAQEANNLADKLDV